MMSICPKKGPLRHPQESLVTYQEENVVQYGSKESGYVPYVAQYGSASQSIILNARSLANGSQCMPSLQRTLVKGKRQHLVYQKNISAPLLVSKNKTKPNTGSHNQIGISGPSTLQNMRASVRLQHHGGWEFKHRQ